MSFDFSHRSVSPSGQSDLRYIKLGAHCFRKFALILCEVNFLRVVNVHC